MEMGNNQMREKPCLTDYKMKTRKRALLETVMEMVDSFQIIRNGLKDSNWSEIECIPANGAQHFMIHQLREDYWVELIDMAIMRLQGFCVLWDNGEHVYDKISRIARLTLEQVRDALSVHSA